MDSRHLYLKDVLGVNSWIRSMPPEGASLGAVTPLNVEVSTAGERPTLVRVNLDHWSEAEQAMVDKILAAVQLTDTPIADEETLAPHILMFDSQEPPSRSIVGDQIFWNLGPLRNLIQGTPPQIQQAKRDVWNLLKQLKEEVGV